MRSTLGSCNECLLADFELRPNIQKKSIKEEKSYFKSQRTTSSSLQLERLKIESLSEDVEALEQDWLAALLTVQPTG